MHDTLLPAGWQPPIGYANGMSATGRTIVVGGQIGWNAEQQFDSDGIVDQVEQTLANIVAVLAAGGARPEHLVSMTWYFTNLDEYRDNLRDIGRAYRATIGRVFPAMAVIGNIQLVERRAKVEIQAIAVVPEGPSTLKAEDHREESRSG